MHTLSVYVTNYPPTVYIKLITSDLECASFIFSNSKQNGKFQILGFSQT